MAHFRSVVTDLHTSKRMHFIEDFGTIHVSASKPVLHTSKRMHFIEESMEYNVVSEDTTCIRQNVCTSLRRILAPWYEKPHGPDVYLEVQHPCWSCNSNSSSANASAGVR